MLFVCVAAFHAGLAAGLAATAQEELRTSSASFRVWLKGDVAKGDDSKITGSSIWGRGKNQPQKETFQY